MKNHSKSRRLFVLLSFIVIGLLQRTPAHAEETQDRAAEINAIFSWATPLTPGCAVAVSKDGTMVVNRAYGLADLERNVPLTPDSVFDVGSVQKQFTAASVLLLVEEGHLSLSEDVRKYIPELPDYGHTITLNHLLTHTSGIRDWTGILPLAEGDPDVLTLILRQRGLGFAPGEEWSYSSSGYELLKEIVARTSGMSFSDFTRTRLFEPLGMKSSRYQTDITEIVSNRALGYEKEGEQWKLDMHFGNRRGGGALLTTASDLIIWDDALMHGRLGEFVTKNIHEPARLNNGRKLSYARGLNLGTYRGRTVYHTGGAAGYSALLGRYPEQGLSIAITCNADGSARSAYAGRIIDLFAPPALDGSSADRSTPAANSGGAGVEGVDLSGRAGLYFSESTGQPLRLIVNDGSLQIARGPRLVAMNSDRFRNPKGSLFFRSEDEFELRFVSADELELESMEGVTTRYRRAQPYTPSAVELNGFAGRYESEEMGSVLEVVPEKEGLLIRFHRTPDKALRFTPVDRDTFTQGPLTVRFLRDGTGKVLGYDYSNPVVRNIRFVRLSDCTNRP